MWSIVGTRAVKHSPSEANAQAETNTIGMTTGKYSSSSRNIPSA